MRDHVIGPGHPLLMRNIGREMQRLLGMGEGGAEVAKRQESMACRNLCKCLPCRPIGLDGMVQGFAAVANRDLFGGEDAERRFGEAGLEKELSTLRLDASARWSPLARRSSTERS